MPRRCAIVCLTRGYSHLGEYTHLIERNRSIYEVINRERKYHYPLLIWHEGNIPVEHQLYILAHEWNNDVRFIDISRIFQLPPKIDERDLKEDWSVGYRLMCRFHFYYIWKYTKGFEYVMRLDEDCVLLSSSEDPFGVLSDLLGDFAAPSFTPESHRLTNRTLSAFVHNLPATRSSKTQPPYNHIFPYTNCYVTRTAFWREPEVQNFLESVRQNLNSICLRWGDLPVLGVALNLFADPGKVHRLPQLSYWHGSHNAVIASHTEQQYPND
jgi:hypothetical protein